MGMNIMIYGIGMLGFWLCGFAFMWGGSGQTANLGMLANLGNEWSISLFGKDFGILATRAFFLSGSAYDVSVMTLFLFQMVFMDTRPPSHRALAERWKFLAFCVYGLFISMIIYPV